MEPVNSCPFCGSGKCYPRSSGRQIMCQSCGAEGPNGIGPSDAWGQWRKRATPPLPNKNILDLNDILTIKDPNNTFTSVVLEGLPAGTVEWVRDPEYQLRLKFKPREGLFTKPRDSIVFETEHTRVVLANGHLHVEERDGEDSLDIPRWRRVDRNNAEASILRAALHKVLGC